MEHITAVPFSMKQYIDQKMSSNIYSKLICTNKCIFAYYRMIVIDEMNFTVGKEDYRYWKYDDDSNQLSNPWIKPSITIDLNKNKLWITKKLCASSNIHSNPFPLILKHICRNNISQLVLFGNQFITKKEFLIIASNLTELTIGEVNDDYGNLMAIGEVLSMTPKLEYFLLNAYLMPISVDLSLISEASLQLPSLPNLKSFCVKRIDNCNFNNMCQFIKNHTQAKFYLDFYFIERYEGFKTLALKEFRSATPKYDGSLRITCSDYRAIANVNTFFNIY